MRNLSKLIFQRVVAVSVGIALQIIFLIVTATYLRADFFWIRIAMTVLSWVVVIYIISCGVNPSYKIAWIVLILAFPVAGSAAIKFPAMSTGRCSRSSPSPCSSCGRTMRRCGS